MGLHNFPRSLCAFLFCVLLTTANAQTVRYVDDDAQGANTGTSWTDAYTDLQSALAGSQSGDQIWVAAGRYVGNFTLKVGVEVYGGFAATETELTQRDWTANRAILDGNAVGSVVTSPSGATATTRIDGFTITNGSGTVLDPDLFTYGGGLYLNSSSPTIANNTITGNRAGVGFGGYGGGLYLNSSSPTIANNTITGNSADRYGGGLWLYSSSPTIANNTITGNIAYSDGGGLYLSGGSPTITNNTITGNGAGWSGGGLCLYYSSPTIANNTITGNSARDGGGGLWLYSSSPTIASNTIARNSAGGGGGLGLYSSSPAIANNTIMGNSANYGGGLYLYDSSPTMANTIVAFNSSGIYNNIDEWGQGTPTLRYNCVYGNSAYNYSGITDPTGTDGNISADPRLADPRYGNTHIQPDSPCVNAGSNADAFGDLDMDGQPRIQPFGGTVDIGADESDGKVWSVGPYIILRVSPVGDDTNDGSSWAFAKRTVQAGIDAASALGGEVWVQAGTYYERITLHPYAYVYGGFGSVETLRDERDWRANVTTLDGQQEGSVVTAREGHRISGIDGFTIMNGLASYGGGVALYNSSPTIANNTIAGNSATVGGGLYLEFSSPTIANNTITGNSAIYDGGGLCLDYSSPTIANNTITGNSTNNSGWSFGGGLFLSNSSATIVNNTITGNSAAYYGGGLDLTFSQPMIANNTITGNSAIRGGGLYLYGASPTIANNTIMANSASSDGGGLYLNGSYPTITNNTITGNSAPSNGGGLYLEDSSPRIANTIVAFNSSGIRRSGATVAPTLRYNCVYGNTAYNYSGLTVPVGTNGNISADPRLADPQYGHAHLQPDSPCVNTGRNADAFGDLDMDGQPRIQPFGGTVDIGADESDGTVWSASPYVIVRVSPLGDDINDGSSWAFAKRTVQAGIDAASALGGEVWVQAGTYQEQIILRPFAHVYGGFAGGEKVRDKRDWHANVTTLDGQWRGSVVTVRAGYGTVSAIDGFTITDGSGTAVDGDTHGGGLYVYYSSPAIANNTITGNSASSGGGLCMYSSSPTISNNTITGNRADYGGGLYLNGGSPTIENNTIAGNSANNSGTGYGGGLYVYESSPTIANNTITGNSTSSGGGLYVDHSSPTIANNTITGNSAGHFGGGLALVTTYATIMNNMITGNRATDGGALYFDSYWSPTTIANNTITGNSADVGGGLYLSSSTPSTPTIVNTIVAFNSSGVYRSSGTPMLRYNCVFGNVEYDYSGLTNPTGTNGNISADPRLAGLAYGNMHIQPDSPCVDAGRNLSTLGNLDIDSQPRIQPTGGTVDIGADESDGTVWSEGPYVIVRVSPVGNDANDGSSWALAKRTVQAGIDAASTAGGEVWVQAGTYQERSTLHFYAYVYGGFAGVETARDQRDWATNVTTLDGQRQGSVVSARGGFRISAIDGFTITNGSAAYGGGLYLYFSSPTIANSTITGNSAYEGGGLYMESSSPTILNNTIMGNSAYWNGGGLYLYGSSPTITNNTITANIASSNGGGLSLHAQSSPTIANTIIAFNSSGVYRYGTTGTPRLRYNGVDGNTAYNYAGLNDPTGTNGNISADPRLVRNPSDGGDGWGDDPATPGVDEGANDDCGDLRLQPGSPAINAGDPSFVPQPGETDLDAHARVLCGQVDMGAYEFGIGDYDCDQSVDLADFALWAGCMGGPSGAELRLANGEERMTQSFDLLNGASHEIGSQQFEIGNSCVAFDFDADGDTDVRDFAGFQRVFVGQ